MLPFHPCLSRESLYVHTHTAHITRRRAVQVFVLFGCSSWHRTSTHNTHSYLQLLHGFDAWSLWLGCLRSALGQARPGVELLWRPDSYNWAPPSSAAGANLGSRSLVLLCLMPATCCCVLCEVSSVPARVFPAGEEVQICRACTVSTEYRGSGAGAVWAVSRRSRH